MDDIEIVDGISIAEQRQLLEITREMISLINKEEFLAICNVYATACERLLEQK